MWKKLLRNNITLTLDEIVNQVDECYREIASLPKFVNVSVEFYAEELKRLNEVRRLDVLELRGYETERLQGFKGFQQLELDTAHGVLIVKPDPEIKDVNDFYIGEDRNWWLDYMAEKILIRGN